MFVCKDILVLDLNIANCCSICVNWRKWIKLISLEEKNRFLKICGAWFASDHRHVSHKVTREVTFLTSHHFFPHVMVSANHRLRPFFPEKHLSCVKETRVADHSSDKCAFINHKNADARRGREEKNTRGQRYSPLSMTSFKRPDNCASV